MKKHISVLLVGLAAVGAPAEDYHIFTDTLGRAVEGKVTSFDSYKKQIQIERKDGKRVWVSPTLFSVDDQVYIKEWIAAYQILDESSLRISMKKKHGDKYGSKKESKKGETIFFEVTFDNHTDAEIGGLRVEYKYFIKRNNYEGQDSEYTVPGTLPIVGIDPKQSRVISTKPQQLDEYYGERQEREQHEVGPTWNLTTTYTTKITYYKMSEDELEGIWIRVYGPSVGDTRIYRDITYPSGLDKKKSWDQPRS